MQDLDWTIPDNYRQIFTIASWALGILGGTWLVTGVVGYMHRRAYNLTHAESGRSQNVKPDFLKVDQAARKAAIDRGEAFDKQLADKAAGPKPPAEAIGSWARMGASLTAIITLVAAIVGSLGKAEVLQKGAERIGSFEKLGVIFREYPFGASIAVICIVANVIAFNSSRKKK